MGAGPAAAAAAADQKQSCPPRPTKKDQTGREAVVLPKVWEEEEDEWSVTEKSNTAAADRRTQSRTATKCVNAEFIPGPHVNPIRPVCRINPAVQRWSLATSDAFYSSAQLVWRWTVGPAWWRFQSSV